MCHWTRLRISYGRLKEQEQALCAEIDALIEQASRCDQEEDQAYRRTGYKLPEDLPFKQERFACFKPGKAIEDSKQISFADTEARIMGKHGPFDCAYNGQISAMPTINSS